MQSKWFGLGYGTPRGLTLVTCLRTPLIEQERDFDDVIVCGRPNTLNTQVRRIPQAEGETACARKESQFSDIECCGCSLAADFDEESMEGDRDRAANFLYKEYV